MATSDIQFCSLCKEDDVNNEAITWCTACVTFLCPDCDKHHSRNKSSKQHKTLPSEDYRKLPDFIIKTGNRCPDHDQQFELYCPNHSTACCLQCFTEKHQNCADLKRLPDIMKDVKSSTLMTSLEKDLCNAKENFESIAYYLKGRLSTILNHKTNKIKEIHLMRKSLNEHLDKLEQKTIEELDVEHTKLETQIKKLINQVEVKHSHVKNNQEDLAKIKNFATDLQMFIGIQEIENMTTEEVGYLQKLRQSRDLDELDIELKISPDITSTLQNLTCFGTVSVTSVPCSLKLKTEFACQVPIFVPTVKTINDIRPVLIQKITLPNKHGKITGCQILPNGNLLFLDYATKQLIQCNNRGNDIETVMTFKGCPYDICYIEGNTVAVTLPDKQQILKINLVNREITTTITRKKSHCYGIDSNGDTIVILERRDLKSYATFLDLAGNKRRCIKMDGLFWEFVSVYGGKLYCTDWKKNKVLCMDENGDKVWEIDIELKSPIGIGVDNNQFIYVACKNNVIIISPDGVTSRIILSEADGINNTTSIFVDRNSQTLLVSNMCDGNAFVFNI